MATDESSCLRQVSSVVAPLARGMDDSDEGRIRTPKLRILRLRAFHDIRHGGGRGARTTREARGYQGPAAGDKPPPYVDAPSYEMLRCAFHDNRHGRGHGRWLAASGRLG